MLTKLYGRAIYLLCYFLPFKWMLTQIPTHTLVSTLARTSKRRYLAERRVYRITNYVLGQGRVLTKREYQIYKAVSEKYGWFYIKDTHDD